MTIRVHPTEFHGPAWEAFADRGGDRLIEHRVWAPRDEPRPRLRWTAYRGPVHSDIDDRIAMGETLDEVLELFDDEVAEAFGTEITRYMSPADGETRPYEWSPQGYLPDEYRVLKRNERLAARRRKDLTSVSGFHRPEEYDTDE